MGAERAGSGGAGGQGGVGRGERDGAENPGGGARRHDARPRARPRPIACTARSCMQQHMRAE